MNSAMPMLSGLANSSASSDDQIVPKMSGPTYVRKLSPLRIGLSAGSSVRAGMLCTTRKTVTATRTARIRMPEPSAVPENTASPSRRLRRTARGAVVVVLVFSSDAVGDGGRGPARSAGPRIDQRSADQVDRGVHLVAQRVRQGRRARGIRGHVLTLGARDEREVR